jgi:hypothetical protein
MQGDKQGPSEPCQNLHDYLALVKPGTVTDPVHLESLLAACWDEFEGASAEGMAGYKLHGRMKEVVWEPPRLRFLIERHGATVRGSTRAERQGWQINVEDTTAYSEPMGYTQVEPRQPKWDAEGTAERIANLILNGHEDERLKWKEDGRVQVLIGKILPAESAVKQTLQGRRNRFAFALAGRLTRAGWQLVGRHTYARIATSVD